MYYFDANTMYYSVTQTQRRYIVEHSFTSLQFFLNQKLNYYVTLKITSYVGIPYSPHLPPFPSAQVLCLLLLPFSEEKDENFLTSSIDPYIVSKSIGHLALGLMLDSESTKEDEEASQRSCSGAF